MLNIIEVNMVLHCVCGDEWQLTLHSGPHLLFKSKICQHFVAEQTEDGGGRRVHIPRLSLHDKSAELRSKAKYPAPFPRIQRPRQSCPDSEVTACSHRCFVIVDWYAKSHRTDSALILGRETPRYSGTAHLARLTAQPPEAHSCQFSGETPPADQKSSTSPPEYYVEASRCHSSRRSVARGTKKKVCDLHIHVTR